MARTRFTSEASLRTDLEDRPQSREIQIAGNALIADFSGCLFWPEENLLVVSDLHLEKGSSYATRRDFMPPFDTGQTLIRLQQQLNYWKPETVISLGDSFHDRDAAERLPDEYASLLRLAMRDREWIWIKGNHDPCAPDGFGGLDARELQIGNLCFRHEPQWNFPKDQYVEISGHMHPAAKIRRRGKSVYRRCFAGDGKRLIIPSFGSFTGGLNILDEAYSGLFDPGQLTAWMLGNKQVFEIDGRHLVR